MCSSDLRLVVDSDATATAHNILAHELLYRSAIVGDVIAYVVSILYTLLLYNLFRPVSRRLSLVAAVFSLVGLSIHLCICVFLLAPLVVLGGAQSLNAVSMDQSQALALTFLNLHDDGYAVGMVLFGFYNILIGYLIFSSIFLPRCWQSRVCAIRSTISRASSGRPSRPIWNPTFYSRVLRNYC